MMKKILPILLLCSLLWGCGIPTQVIGESTEPTAISEETGSSQPTETTEPTTDTEAPETELPTESLTEEDDPVEVLRNALEEVSGFDFEYLFMELAFYGFKQHTTQTSARDGSFHFINEARYWNHNVQWEETQKVEYYYRYEDGALHFYMRENEGGLRSGKLSQRDEEELKASEKLLVGSAVILPSYLENFAQGEEEEGLLCFYYDLPCNQVLRDQTVVTSFIQGAADYASVDPATLDDTYIHCTLWVEPETMRPVRLSQDYEELKPYLLSEGALSGEYAFDSDFLYLQIRLSYDGPETTAIPMEFLNKK